VPDDLLALDGTVDLVHGDFERSEVGFNPVDLGEFLSELIDSSDCPARSPFRRTRLRLLFLHFAHSLGGAAGTQNSD